MFSTDVAKWVVTTIASFLLIGLFVLSIWNPPIITLDPALATALLIAGLAGLGITQVGAFRAVQSNETLTKLAKAKK